MNRSSVSTRIKKAGLIQFLVLILGLSASAQAEVLLTPFAERQGCATEATRRAHGRATNRCWYPKYDDYVLELITESSEFVTGGAPSGILEVCPNYESLVAKQKQDFWVYFIQALAVVESSFDRYSQLQENWFHKDGSPVISEGLLQLSYSDRGRGPGCSFSESRDAKLALADRSIFEPKKNLQCGISILKNQLAKNGLFHNGSYWNPLRKKAKYNSDVNKCMKKAPDGASEIGCQGLSHRRILAQFWEEYPSKRGKGKNLCGLRNVLSFCGQLDCQ